MDVVQQCNGKKDQWVFVHCCSFENYRLFVTHTHTQTYSSLSFFDNTLNTIQYNAHGVIMLHGHWRLSNIRHGLFNHNRKLLYKEREKIK